MGGTLVVAQATMSKRTSISAVYRYGGRMASPLRCRTYPTPIDDGPHNSQASDRDAPSSVEGNIPTPSASEAHLCCGKQFVDAAPVKADDDLIADDDGRGTAALVGPNQLLQRRRVLGDIALDEIGAFLRKILFRGMARASPIGGVDFNRLFGHGTIPPCPAFHPQGDIMGASL